MKKKSFSKKTTSKTSHLQHEDLVDFANYLVASISAGLSVVQALRTMLPFLEQPLRNEVFICITQADLGLPIDNCLCELANKFPEMHFRRIIKMIILTKQCGGNIPRSIEDISYDLRLSKKLDVAKKKWDFSGLLREAEKETSPATSNSQSDTIKPYPISLNSSFLKKQNFWKFLEIIMNHGCSLLLIGKTSKSREKLIDFLGKHHFEQTLRFKSKSAIDFLIKMSEKKCTLGIIDSTSVRSALNQLELYALQKDAPAPLVRSAITDQFSFIIFVDEWYTKPFVRSVTEIQGLHGNQYLLQDLFYAKTIGLNEKRELLGQYFSTGLMPHAVMDIESTGKKIDRDLFANS